MQNTTRIALFLLAAASAMAGFDGGCGTVEPLPLPPAPSPTPNPPDPECVDLLEEAACTADTSCRAIYVETACVCPGCEPGSECPPCDCPPPTRTFVGCEDQTTGCASLDEAACNADAACEVIYSQPNCISVPPPDEEVPCDGPGCGCNEQPVFAGCRDRTTCPPILCQPCEFGMAVDANGCGTCECLPPPNGCEGLEEQICIATPGCAPAYGADDTGGARPAPPCDCAGADCICPEDPIPSGYLGCYPVAPTCEQLNEAQCSMTPGCHPEYLATPCARICPEEDPNCGGDEPVCPPVFVGCVGDEPPPVECRSDVDCGFGGFCEYGTSTEPAPGSDPSTGEDRALPAPPPETGICRYPRCGDGGPVFCDAIPPTCEIGQVAGEWGGCWACFDARTCTPINTSGACTSDADCFGGYCSDGSGSGGAAPPGDGDTDPGFRPEPPVPPPPSGQCVYPVCGDGQPVFCNAVPPSCDIGQVAGAYNGCWACFDARTCSVVNQPIGCTSDVECPNGYCDQSGADRAPPPGGGGTGAPIAPPEGGQCVFPTCGDGSMLQCRSLPPPCAPGETVGIVNGCWQCLDARSCGGTTTPCDPATTDCG